MFEQYNEIYVKQDTNFRSAATMYTITVDRKIIGTVEETLESTKDVWNRLLKVFTPANIYGLELNILDRESNILGTIKKDKGFYNDFLLFSKEGKHIGTIKEDIKMRSPKMTLLDESGQEIVQAVGGFGATDFSIEDSETGEQISTIKRRSLIYDTVQENMLNDDGYYIEVVQDSLLTLSLIAMGVVLDTYYFHR